MHRVQGQYNRECYLPTRALSVQQPIDSPIGLGIMLDNFSPGQALTLLVVLSVIPILYGLFGANKNRNVLLYPPGPKGNFLLGNLLDVPTFKPWLSYTKMGKQYNSKRGAFLRRKD